MSSAPPRIHHTLKPCHMHFGYRVANEIAAFMLNAQKFCIGGDEILPFAFDLQVMQKIRQDARQRITTHGSDRKPHDCTARFMHDEQSKLARMKPV